MREAARRPRRLWWRGPGAVVAGSLVALVMDGVEVSAGGAGFSDRCPAPRPVARPNQSCRFRPPPPAGRWAAARRPRADPDVPQAARMTDAGAGTRGESLPGAPCRPPGLTRRAVSDRRPARHAGGGGYAACGPRRGHARGGKLVDGFSLSSSLAVSGPAFRPLRGGRWPCDRRPRASIHVAAPPGALVRQQAGTRLRGLLRLPAGRS